MKIAQVQTKNQWHHYLELMWLGMKAGKGSKYQKNDFEEPGCLNLLLTENKQAVFAIYSKNSPNPAKKHTITIHRWGAKTPQLAVKYLPLSLDHIIKHAQQHNYQKIEALVATQKEIKIFKNKQFEVAKHHPNSTKDRPLIWVKRQLS